MIPVASDPKPLHENPKMLSARVNAKLMEGDVAAAVRVVASDDTVLHSTPEILSTLQSKHPSPPVDVRHVPVSESSPHLIASADDVIKALNSFPQSSSGAVDAFVLAILNP